LTVMRVMMGTPHEVLMILTEALLCGREPRARQTLHTTMTMRHEYDGS